MSVYKVGSLFAGVGGICLGFENAKIDNSRYKLLWANEIDEYACITYKNNFKHKLFEGDIQLVLNPQIINCKENKDKYEYYKNLRDEILSEPIDILTGGFPCQAFSIAGNMRGFDDERGNLFLSIINLIEQLGEKYYKPRVLFLENVKNLKSHSEGKTYKIIKESLEKIGYIIHEYVLNTMDYSDLPQNRERIYIIGFLNKLDADRFQLFTNDKILEYKISKTEEERIYNIKKIIDNNIKKDRNYEYYYTKDKYPNYFMTEEEFINSKKENRINLEEEITEQFQFYQCRRGMYVRKNKRNVCPTLTANMGTGGHNVPLIKVNDGIRKLTPEETFKLQGFPIGERYNLPKLYNNKKYSNAQLYKQAGNAVSVPIVELLAKEILKILEKND